METNQSLTQYTDLKLIHLHELIASVKDESNHQLTKWGLQTHSIFEWITYTTEELGEAAKEAIEFEYRDGSKEKVYKEAIQVATLALKIAEMIRYQRNS